MTAGVALFSVASAGPCYQREISIFFFSLSLFGLVERLDLENIGLKVQFSSLLGFQLSRLSEPLIRTTASILGNVTHSDLGKKW